MTKRDQMMAIRLTVLEREAIDTAAAECEMGPTTWARFVILNAIGRTPANRYVKKAKRSHTKMIAKTATTALLCAVLVACGDDSMMPDGPVAGSDGSGGTGGQIGGPGGDGGTGGDAGAGGTDPGTGGSGGGSICDTKPDRLYCIDTDRDGFGDSADCVVVERCDSAPGGLFVLVKNDEFDCYDDNEHAYPGSTRPPQSDDRGDGSFDYDCDGLETPSRPDFSCDSPDQIGWDRVGTCIDPWDCSCILRPEGCTFPDDVPACGTTGAWGMCGQAHLGTKFQLCN